MFVTNWISTTKIQKISEITNFFRHYFLSRTEVYSASFQTFGLGIDSELLNSSRNIVFSFLLSAITTVEVMINSARINLLFIVIVVYVCLLSFRNRYLAIRQAPVIPARPFRLEVTILESSFMMLRENFLMPIFTGSVR